MAYKNSWRKILPKWLQCIAYFKFKKRFKHRKKVLKELQPDLIALEEIKEFKRDHSLLLYMVWKKGIPCDVRAKIWPIAISNSLEITHNLFSFLQNQA